MQLIVLSERNITNKGNGNNTLVYEFPSSVDLDNCYVAVVNANMYYSWFNVNTSLSNTFLSIVWYFANSSNTANVPVLFNISIPPGIYTIADINQYIQFFCLQNGLYLEPIGGSGGDNLFFISIEQNTSRYGIQINTYQYPNEVNLPDGYQFPTGEGPYAPFNPVLSMQPGVESNGVVTFDTNSSTFNALIGFPQNFSTSSDPLNPKGGSVSLTNTISYLSTTSPILQPLGSVILSLSNVKNNYGVPNNIIYSFANNASPGSFIESVPPNFAWSKFTSGTYRQLTMYILSSVTGQPMPINDPNINITLAIMDKEESQPSNNGPKAVTLR
jgi:hypothetical protein